MSGGSGGSSGSGGSGGSSGSGVPASAFSPDALQQAVHATLSEALAAIPAGHTHAVMLDATYTTAGGPAGRVLLVQKVPRGWEIAASAGYDKPHGVSAGVDLLRSW